jgi:KDO2-lipid IV(A) lauroyltransferase
MKKIVDKIQEKVISSLLFALCFVSQHSSDSARIRIGKFIGDVLRKLSKKRYNITFDNIQKSLPDKTEAECKKIAIDSYRNLGITMFELMAIPTLSEEQLKAKIKYENIELINKKRELGNGVILLSGHYGNWELLAYTAGYFTGIPVTIIVKPQRNKTADRVLNSYRTHHNNEVVSMYKAARPIVSQLRKGNMIALLADQSATKDKDVFVDFFGRPAATYESPAAMALRLNSPIVIGFSERMDDGTYRVRLDEISFDDLKELDKEEAVRILTERHVKALENQIRKRPELWAWQHKRWKHKPKVKSNENK